MESNLNFIKGPAEKLETSRRKLRQRPFCGKQNLLFVAQDFIVTSPAQASFIPGSILAREQS